MWIFYIDINWNERWNLMLGFSKKEIVELLEKVKISESQKDAIVDIIYRNNQRIEQELEYIIDQILDERERRLIKEPIH